MARVKAVTVHCSSPTEAFRSSWIAGSATAIAEVGKLAIPTAAAIASSVGSAAGVDDVGEEVEASRRRGAQEGHRRRT